MTLEEYLEYIPSIDEIGKEWFDSRKSYSIYTQMLDAFGEADHAVNANNRENSYKNLKVLHHICCCIYLNDSIDEGIKKELKKAEWILNDFLLGENVGGYTKDEVMSWFNKWCYDVDYDYLIKVGLL